jgi:hypothetical protein
MCKAGKQLIFCTCTEKKPSETRAKYHSFEIVEDTEAYHETYYVWELQRTVRAYTKMEKFKMMGSLTRPIQRLDEELHATYVLDQLNSKALFDFDYTPADGDEVSIRKAYKHPQVDDHYRPTLYFEYMGFVYEKGTWYFGMVDHFEYEKAAVSKGKLKIQEKKDA